MGIAQVTVRELVREAVGGELDIPEFQRDFVWDPQQVRTLADSLCRGYPVGTVLLWDAGTYQESRHVAGNRRARWIVDGQQRITALCILFGAKPYWWPDAQSWNRTLDRYDVMARVVPEGPEDELELRVRNPALHLGTGWASVRQILQIQDPTGLAALAQELARAGAGSAEEAMGRFSPIFEALDRIWRIRDVEIPVVQIDHGVEDVAEIFRRLNQAGTRVKEADVTLALAAVQNPGWVSGEYLPFRQELEDQGWDLDAGIFVRTMAGIGMGRVKLSGAEQEELWGSDRMRRVWAEAREAIGEVLRRLEQHGILTDALLPSTNSLIPLVVLHHRFGDKGDYRFGRALRWFLLANRDGRYSGSALTSLHEDVRAIAEARGFDEAIVALEGRLRTQAAFSPNEFRERHDRSGSRFARLMLYLLLFRAGARDWHDGTRVVHDPAAGRVAAGLEPHWHHIYPRALLRRHGVDDASINALANVTVMNARTNVRRLGDYSPALVIRERGVDPAVLRQHLIPEPWASDHSDEAWSVTRYGAFLDARAGLIARACEELLEELARA